MADPSTNTPASTPQRGIPARWLLLFAGVAVVGSIVGWGVYGAFNRQVVGTGDAPSEEEIAFLELADESAFEEASGKAKLTDVVPAVHQVDGDSQSTIIQASGIQTAGERPATNPSAWLSGTIEEVTTEMLPAPPPLEFARRRFDSTSN